MRKSCFKLLLAAVLLTLPSFAYAQLDMSLQNIDPKLPTSQSYNFIRYGKIGASLYTGTINYSLPIYTYTDQDFTIPISFDYASNGLRPNNRTGNLGMEWILNTGGSITREIKGIADEKSVTYIAPGSNIGANLRGFYFLYTSNINISSLTDEVVQDDMGNIVFVKKQTQSGITYYYDPEPDIFHYNFMGFTGSFHMLPNGEVKIFNSNETSGTLKIDLLNMDTNFDQITITTGDGYTYSFYGNYCGEYVREDPLNANSKSTVLTWKLHCIKAPNGREVRYYFGETPGLADRVTQYNPRSNYYQMVCAAHNVQPFPNFTESYSETVFSTPLSRITVTDGPEIKFSYTNNYDGEMRYHQSTNPKFQFALPKVPLLSKIDVVVGNAIKTCNLSYVYPPTSSTTNYPPLLGSVTISGEGVYHFEYHNRTDKTFPCLGSFSTDFWGFYNGKNNYDPPTDFIKNGISYNSTDYTETLGTNIKDPDAAFSLIGMLKRITYPTGGFTDITYEAHDYAKEVARNASTQYLPVLKDVVGSSKITGGHRIKKWVNFTAAGTRSDSTVYTYIQNGKSSGILLNAPRYGIKYTASGNVPPWNNITKSVDFYSSSSMYSFDKTHIEYSQVTEKRSDNSENTYYFSSSSDYLDEMIYDDNSLWKVPTFLMFNNNYTLADFTIGTNNHLVQNILTPTSSMQEKRGKLIMKDIKKDANNIVRKEKWTYENTNAFVFNKQHIVGETYRKVDRKEFDVIFSKHTTTDYGSSNIELATHLRYNKKRQIISVANLESSGDSLITEYKYVTDITPTPSAGVYSVMLAKNVVDQPLSEEVYLKKSGVKKKIGGKQFTFFNPVATNTSIIRVSQIDTWDSNAGVWRVETKFNKYDSKGNLLEVEDPNGIKTTYIWGHKGLFPVAIAENLSLAEVKNISGLNTIETTPLIENLNSTQIQALRNTQGRIHLYKYKPFVGISSYTDPSGNEMLYDYNLSGKLKRIKDSKGILHNEFFYSPDNKQ